MKEFEDYFNWDLQIKSIDETEDLTPQEKEEAKVAFEYLKGLFGTIHVQNRIPFRHYLINKAPWTRRRLTDLGTWLREMEAAGNFTSLRKRIRKYKTYDEALSVLEVAIKFSRAGFMVNFDTETLVLGRRKKPDLEVLDELEESFFVEVSMMGFSDQIRLNQSFRDLTFGQKPQLNSACRLFRNLKKKELPELIRRVKQVLDQAWEDRKCIYAVHPDLLEFIAAPLDKVEEVKALMDERHLSFGKYSMPNENFNLSQPLKQKTQAELKQLPENKPNVVWIKVVDYSFFRADLRTLLIELREFIQGYNHIHALVVSNYWMGSRLDSFSIDENCFFYAKEMNDIRCENLLVILNPESKEISDSFRNKFYSALTL